MEIEYSGRTKKEMALAVNRKAAKKARNKIRMDQHTSAARLVLLRDLLLQLFPAIRNNLTEIVSHVNEQLGNVEDDTSVSYNLTQVLHMLGTTMNLLPSADDIEAMCIGVASPKHKHVQLEEVMREARG